MKKLLRLPKVQLSLALLLIFLSAFRQLSLQQYLFVLLLSLGSSVLFDLTISYLRTKKLFIPYAAIATGLIITLIINPNLPWYQIATIAFISMAIKNFVRISNRHIFNPAASGLFVGGLIFSQNVSWWGASFQNLEVNIESIILFIILLSPLYVSALRVRRYLSIFSFLITYALSLFTGNDNLSIIKMAIDPTIIFFAIVMLPEPMTSPSDKNRQVFYGVTIGILNFVITLPFIFQSLSNLIFIPDPLLLSLLLGNLIYFKK